MDEVDEVDGHETDPVEDAGDGEATADVTVETGSDGEGDVLSSAESSADTGTSLASRLDAIIESLLFAAGAPLPLRRLVDTLRGPTAAEVKASLRRLADAYESGERGIRVLQVAGGFQMRTAPENADWVRALLRERPARLGRAALETLAIVAYKQPATRAEIEAIRGVDADSALSTLLAKRLIKIAGRKEAVGRPLMYATTPDFLEAFGLNDLAELPALKEIGPVAENDDDLAEDDAAGALAEDSQPGGHRVAPGGGVADSGGPSEGERPGGVGAGGESPPAP